MPIEILLYKLALVVIVCITIRSCVSLIASAIENHARIVAVSPHIRGRHPDDYPGSVGG